MEVGTSTILDRLSEMEKKMSDYEQLKSRVIALEMLIGVHKDDIRIRTGGDNVNLKS